MYRSKFILDQSLRLEAAASFLNARSYSDQVATRRAELETVMPDTGVNVGTNAGRVSVPDATEETPSLVLPLGADAEEN